MPSIEKIHRILEVLRDNHRTGLSNQEISTRLKIPESTCYRILASLRRFDYVQQRKPGTRYTLGFAHLRFAEAVVEGLDLAAICRPFLEELHGETDETTFLAVLSGRNCVTMETCGHVDTRVSVGRGELMPLHASAAGKAVLAFLPPKEQQEALGQAELCRYTEATITDAKLLRRELDRIRLEGVSYNCEEFHKGINALATPVFDGLGRVVGAIAAVGISVDLDKAQMQEYGELFLDAAEEISFKLGGQFPRGVRAGRPQAARKESVR